MKRFYQVMAALILTVALVFMTACALKQKEINAVVESFMEYWKDGNTDGMADLMTSEVDLGALWADDASESEPDSKGVSPQTVIELLVTVLDSGFTYTVSNTEIYGTYAVVTVLFTETGDDITVPLILNLIEVENTWKICFVAIKGMS